MPLTQLGLPWRGRSATARRASYSGARAAEKRRTTKTAQYAELLRRLGPLTDHQAAWWLHTELATINSIRNGLEHRVVAFDLVEGKGGATRTRWAWAGSARLRVLRSAGTQPDALPLDS
jgi:hypothetical protein